MGIIELQTYQQIKGKWKGTQYEVVKKLGEGGLGKVYLVKRIKTNQYFALKITKDNISINREYNLINKFKNIEMVINALEIDDLEIENEIYYYICLEYIDGMNLQEYVKRRFLSVDAILGLVLVIVEGLNKIHSLGYVLGDLKLENIMLDKRFKQLRIIDLGGVAKKGEFINEYTPGYDRSKWNCGNRVASESYDLFIVTMIIIRLIIREEFNPRLQNINDIIKKMNSIDISKELKEFLIAGLKEEQQSNFFAKGLRKIYNREKLSKRNNMIEKLDARINVIFLCSVSLLITTTIFILLKL
ncbi:protein kinase domain-containing protein [Serpentinicella alkaliphila]|uniref:Serine/threonine-protein kinase n=1 Tax=Serpentinicella alkaliphila TaxID=1734049 RepID=A0A4R2SVL5_9FIRM|nr:protein kinase [Serpentinicella alkaliphila]QUH25360.1 protein kinase [Serpentinicella alkaliphila]TCP93335.1 serine/threonine-protein kinase [Serpentinicella alkaliphila]